MTTLNCPYIIYYAIHNIICVCVCFKLILILLQNNNTAIVVVVAVTISTAIRIIIVSFEALQIVLIVEIIGLCRPTL